MIERPKLLVIDYTEYAIETAVDVELLIAELESVADDYPGYLPVLRVIGWGEENGS